MISRMSLRVRLNVERAIFRAFPSEVIFRQARYEKSKQFIRSEQERGAWFSPRSQDEKVEANPIVPDESNAMAV